MKTYGKSTLNAKVNTCLSTRTNRQKKGQVKKKSIREQK